MWIEHQSLHMLANTPPPCPNPVMGSIHPPNLPPSQFGLGQLPSGWSVREFFRQGIVGLALWGLRHATGHEGCQFLRRLRATAWGVRSSLVRPPSQCLVADQPAPPPLWCVAFLAQLSRVPRRRGSPSTGWAPLRRRWRPSPPSRRCCRARRTAATWSSRTRAPPPSRSSPAKTRVSMAGVGRCVRVARQTWVVQCRSQGDSKGRAGPIPRGVVRFRKRQI